MYLPNPRGQAYRDFTRNGLNSTDPSPYPSKTNSDRQWISAMILLETRQSELPYEQRDLGTSSTPPLYAA